MKQKNHANVKGVGIVLYECDFSQAIYIFFLTSMGGSDLIVEGRTEKGRLGKLGSKKKWPWEARQKFLISSSWK